MSWIYRREIPIIITIIMTTVILIQYFLADPIIVSLSVVFQLWGVIIAAFAMLLGLITYTIHHVREIRKKRAWYSIWSIFCTYLMIAIGFIFSTSSSTYLFIMNNMILPMSMAITSFITFFICSASFRAFRARNRDAAILLISAVIVMLSNIPIGNVILPGILPLGTWFQNVLILGGNRGLIIVMGVGMIVAGIRQIFGYETGAIRE
jgi:hypothetical protein